MHSSRPNDELTLPEVLHVVQQLPVYSKRLRLIVNTAEQYLTLGMDAATLIALLECLPEHHRMQLIRMVSHQLPAIVQESRECIRLLRLLSLNEGMEMLGAIGLATIIQKQLLTIDIILFLKHDLKRHEVMKVHLPSLETAKQLIETLAGLKTDSLSCVPDPIMKEFLNFIGEARLAGLFVNGDQLADALDQLAYGNEDCIKILTKSLPVEITPRQLHRIQYEKNSNGSVNRESVRVNLMPQLAERWPQIIRSLDDLEYTFRYVVFSDRLRAYILETLREQIKVWIQNLQQMAVVANRCDYDKHKEVFHSIMHDHPLYTSVQTPAQLLHALKEVENWVRRVSSSLLLQRQISTINSYA